MNGMAVGLEGYKAHTHGEANITLAYENGVLEAQFESPAMSLLGFEHKPKTQTQVETIEKAKTLLKASEKVLSINGANCFASTVTVNILGPAGQDAGDDHSQDHGHHDSNDKHHEQDQIGSSHSEVKATYVFDCANEKQLQSVTTSLFDYFSGLEKIKVNWVTETQQGESILYAASSTVEFK